MLMSPTDGERRQVPRRTVLKGGRIAFNDGRSTIDCKVRNLSTRGAKLVVSSVVGIPDSFELLLDGARQPCRVTWKTPEKLGVEFSTEH